MHRSLCHWLVGWWCVAFPVLAHSQVPQELRSAEQLVAKLESPDTELTFYLDFDVGRIDKALSAIEKYLTRRPHDPAALILSVRLGVMRDMFSHRDPTAQGVPRIATTSYHRILDGVLARDSTVALAHYWKAQILQYDAELAARGSAPGRSGRGPDRPVKAAEEHLRLALDCEPANVSYREEIALHLAFDDQLDSAIALLRHPSTDGNGLQLLLQDLLTFGIPPGGLLDPLLLQVARVTQMSLEVPELRDPGSGSRSNRNAARTFGWSTPIPFADVEDFYRKRWPGVWLDNQDGTLVGALTLQKGSWTPLRDSAAFRTLEERYGQLPPDVLVFLLLPPAAVAELADSAASEPPRVGVMVANGRRSRSGAGGSEADKRAIIQNASAAVQSGLRDTAPPRPKVLPLSGPLYPILENGMLGLIDSLGRVVVDARLDNIEMMFKPPGGQRTAYPWLETSWLNYPFSDIPLLIAWSGRTMLLGPDGTYIPLEGVQPEQLAQPFREGLRPVRWGKEVGFITEWGITAIAPRFDQAHGFRGGHAFVRIGSQWGVVNGDGVLVVPPTWDEVRHDSWTGSGWVAVRIGDRWGIADSSGVVHIQPRFDLARPSLPWFAVQEGGRGLYLRTDGTTALEVPCPGSGCICDVRPFQGALAAVECNGHPGVLDTAGRWVIEPEREGRIWIENDTLLSVSWVSNPDRPAFLTVGGRVVVQSAGSRRVLRYSEGLFAFVDDHTLLWGFLDASGTEVIPPRFQKVGNFSNGMASALIKARTGFLDRSGRWVIPPDWDRINEFRGPLALAARHLEDCSLESAYLNRAGRVVYRWTERRPTVSLSTRCPL